MTVTEVFVDTVGDPDMYQRKLQGLFSHITPAMQVTMCVCLCLFLCLCLWIDATWDGDRLINVSLRVYNNSAVWPSMDGHARADHLPSSNHLRPTHPPTKSINQVTVTKKADSLFKVCSCASIAAKVSHHSVDAAI